MVVLRLARAGAKKMPYYHIVAANSRAKRDGRFLEAVGSFDPRIKGEQVKLDEARVEHWMSMGAKPSETVGQLISRFKKAKKQ